MKTKILTIVALLTIIVGCKTEETDKDKISEKTRKEIINEYNKSKTLFNTKVFDSFIVKLEENKNGEKIIHVSGNLLLKQEDFRLVMSDKKNNAVFFETEKKLVLLISNPTNDFATPGSIKNEIKFSQKIGKSNLKLNDNICINFFNDDQPIESELDFFKCMNCVESFKIVPKKPSQIGGGTTVPVVAYP